MPRPNLANVRRKADVQPCPAAGLAAEVHDAIARYQRERIGRDETCDLLDGLRDLRKRLKDAREIYRRLYSDHFEGVFDGTMTIGRMKALSLT
jgi:hypothetical protein